MKYKYLILLLLFPAILFSQEKYKRKNYYKFTDEVEFKVVGLRKSQAIDVKTIGSHTGTKSIYEISKKGYEFIEFYIKIRNNSDTEKSINLPEFQLVDENSNVYEAYLCASNTELNAKDCKDYEFKIRANRSKSARIFFKPQIPKELNVKFVRISDKDRVEF